MSTKMVEAKLNGQWEIILPEHRAERPEWYTEKGWERARLDALHNEIKKQISYGIQPLVYYVGAEEGEHPALCQMWGAKVVLFEPNPKVWSNIKAIWDANELEKPEGVFVGFASNSTEENPPQLNTQAEGDSDSWPNSAYGDVIGNHGFKELYQESDSYPQIRIDDYVERHNTIPTIITFDCEGSDWQVMRGAEQTLINHKPVIFASIHPEFMFHQYGEYSRDFRNWIIDHGYDETFIDYEHELHMSYKPREIL